MYKKVCKLDRIQKRKGEKERKERGKDERMYKRKDV